MVLKSQVFKQRAKCVYGFYAPGTTMKEMVFTGSRTMLFLPTGKQRFKYTLHPSSKDYLDKLGTVPTYCCEKGSSPSLIEDDNHSDNSSSELDVKFFEVEDVLDRHLSKDTLLRIQSPVQRVWIRRRRGFHLHSLSDPYNFNPCQNLDVKGSTILIRKMAWRSRRRRALTRVNQRNGIRK